MKKKKLEADNCLLIERLIEAEKIINEYKESLADKDVKIEILNNKINLLSSQLDKQNTENAVTNEVSETNETEEESEEVTQEPTVIPTQTEIPSEDTKTEVTETEENSEAVHPIFSNDEIEFTTPLEYASKLIGKIVLESAKANCLLASDENVAKKELVNLVVGKTEVTKSEILDTVTAQISDEEKKKIMDIKFKECLDYFSGVIN